MVRERTFPARPEHVPEARHFVLDTVRARRVPDEVLFKLELAVSEACTNVVVHGYHDREVGDFTVSVELHEDDVRINVRDQGRGCLPRTDSPGLGLGLPLIARLADSFQISSPDEGGTELCLSLSLRPGRAVA